MKKRSIYGNKEKFLWFRSWNKKNNGNIEKHTITGEDRGKQFGIVLVPKGISFDKEIDEFLEKLKKPVRMKK